MHFPKYWSQGTHGSFRCRVQASFRARLTPKPWRMGVERPPGQWPFADAKAERRYERWELSYRNACDSPAVCELLETFGQGDIVGEAEAILSIHDEATRVGTGLPLA